MRWMFVCALSGCIAPGNKTQGRLTAFFRVAEHRNV
jgi:hypothetical protein